MNTYLDPRAGRDDPLSAALGRLSFPHWLAGLTTLNRPWHLAVPKGFVSFYLLCQGQVGLTMDTLPAPLRLETGAVVLLPHGLAHELGDDSLGFARAADTTHRAAGDPLAAGGAAAENATTLVYGHLSLAALGFNPLAGGLPPVCQIQQHSETLLQSFGTLLQVLADEQAGAAPGGRAIVDQLVHVLFMQSLRAFLLGDARLPLAASWFSGSMDPSIGAALGLIHTQPAKPWTVTALARHARMSKSAFSDRFRRIVGKAPLQYLTEYRMQKACTLLRDTELGVKRIAALVGYESASSFCNAFKRWTGHAPVEFRRNKALTWQPTAPDRHLPDISPYVGKPEVA